MVLICDNEYEEAGHILRNELLRQFIPCAVGINTELLSHALAVVVFDLYYTSDVLSDIDPEIILFADKEALLDPLRKKGELKRITSRVEDVFLIKYGFDPYTVSSGTVSDTHDFTVYSGRRFGFPHVEKLMIRFLLLTRESYAKASVISKYCLKSDSSDGAVTVHVNKINLRVSRCAPIKLISSKRLSGYYISRR